MLTLQKKSTHVSKMLTRPSFVSETRSLCLSVSLSPHFQKSVMQDWCQNAQVAPEETEAMRCLSPCVAPDWPLSQATAILGSSVIPPCQNRLGWLTVCSPHRGVGRVTGPLPEYPVASYHCMQLCLPHKRPEVTTLSPLPHCLQGPGSCHTWLPRLCTNQESSCPAAEVWPRPRPA